MKHLILLLLTSCGTVKTVSEVHQTIDVKISGAIPIIIASDSKVNELITQVCQNDTTCSKKQQDEITKSITDSLSNLGLIK